MEKNLDENKRADGAKIMTDPQILSGYGITVDISLLYEIAEDDKAFINTMISTFLETFPVTIGKIDAACKCSDWEEVYRSAHFAKSSLSIIKIDKMLEIVHKIESNAKNKADLQAIPALIETVKEDYIKVDKLLMMHFDVKVKSAVE